VILSDAYIPVKVAILNHGIGGTDLNRVRKDLQAVWKELQEEEKEGEKKGITMVTGDKVERKLWSIKKTHKRFKGDCKKCG
jgi:hypothetical protein